MKEINQSKSIFAYFQELAENTFRVFFAYHIEANEFLYLNPAFEKLWNKSIESIRKNPTAILDAIHPEDREFLIKRYGELRQGNKRAVEFRILPNDGDIKWLCLSDPMVIKEEENKHVIIGIIENTTKIKDHYNILERFASKKNSVLEILSHDLAGPLNNIKGISSLIAEDIKKYGDPNLEKMVGMISKTSERSIHLIREFVKQEFMESANSAFIKTRVNIIHKFNESIEQYQQSDAVLGKTFTFTAEPEEIFMQVDDYKFMQALNNLISNSLKFTPDGGTISIRVEEKPESVLFTVQDNGIGIPAKYHDTLFDKFTAARRTGLKGEPSTGLGMSIIKTIVEWHGGKIWFKSAENVGTTFYIELPKE